MTHRKSNSRKIVRNYTGKVQMTRDGFIFVHVDGLDDDIFVKASKTRRALNGDLVRVAVTGRGSQGKRLEGEVVAILEHSTAPFVGYMHYVGAQAWVLMQSKQMPYDIEVDAEMARQAGAEAGMKVAVVVDGWKRGEICPRGHISDVLGFPGDNDAEMHAILAEFNLPYRFTGEVLKAAEKIPEEITPEDLKGRKDFRDTLTFTIDPSDAKDFDDALSFRKLPSGDYEVGVHIADVSHYVRPGGPVNDEARERGTSVYLVDRTVPMLPEKLSNNLCSLRQDEDKLTFSVVFEMGPKGAVRSRWFGRTVIRSDRRMDYDQAQAIIENPPAEDKRTPLEEAILILNGLAKQLREARFRAGAINFDRPEMKVEIDDKGKPVRVYQKVARESNNLIEEFMLLANRSVAEYVGTGGKMNGVEMKNAKTFVYRVHGEPNYEKLEGLRGFASNFGYKMAEASNGKGAAASLRELLGAAKGKPEYDAFENIALRSMAKAVYSTDNIGHYGLAFSFYTHFTSPIRRYPDLMVHRLLAHYLRGGDSADRARFDKECLHASERELVAADAERTSVKYKLVEFMQDKVGMEFDGSVSGLTEWGMYVELDETHIEGMVPLREMRSDFYEFDEGHYRLCGRRTPREFRLGDRVRIKVKNANLEQRQLDFELIEDEEDFIPAPASVRPAPAVRSSRKRPGRKERLAEYVYYFASDSLQGRRAASRGAIMARDYIVERYKECGLKPFFNGDFVVPFKNEGKSYANVVGLIEGNSLKDEYIVLGAHFDHLGVKKGQIYPGADDNASGSAALIEIARELCARRGELQRSVIIAAFDAEELGLYGSNALADFLDTVVGIENIKLMMSVDMVGWYKQSGKLMMKGTATIRDGRRLATETAKRHSINVKAKNFETSVLTATDTQGFAKKQVPTLAVTTGLKSPYHKPGDKPELIDYNGLDKVSGYLADFAVEAASDPAFAASGKLAPKHTDKIPAFEFGPVASLSGARIRFPDARLTSDAERGFSAGLMGRFNFGKMGLQLNALYEMAGTRFPSLDTPLGKSQKYIQQAVTVPAYLIMRAGDASTMAFLGVGGYYSYAFAHSFGSQDPGWAVNPHQAGMSAVFGFQMGQLLLEWSFRWQLNDLFPGQASARLNTGNYFTLGWVF